MSKEPYVINLVLADMFCLNGCHFLSMSIHLNARLLSYFFVGQVEPSLYSPRLLKSLVILQVF